MQHWLLLLLLFSFILVRIRADDVDMEMMTVDGDFGDMEGKEDTVAEEPEEPEDTLRREDVQKLEELIAKRLTEPLEKAGIVEGDPLTELLLALRERISMMRRTTMAPPPPRPEIQAEKVKTDVPPSMESSSKFDQPKILKLQEPFPAPLPLFDEEKIPIKVEGDFPQPAMLQTDPSEVEEQIRQEIQQEKPIAEKKLLLDSLLQVNEAGVDLAGPNGGYHRSLGGGYLPPDKYTESNVHWNSYHDEGRLYPEDEFFKKYRIY